MADRRPAARVRRGGLRARLTVAIATVVALGLGISFATVYSGTGDQVRHQVDSDLMQDAHTLTKTTKPHATQDGVARAAQRYVFSQPFFGPGARLLVVHVRGVAPISNVAQIFRPGRPGHRIRATTVQSNLEAIVTQRIDNAHEGLQTVKIPVLGQVALLKRTVKRGDIVMTMAIGESLGAVDRAQGGVAHTFVIAGTIAFLATVLVAYLLAARIAGPLRRMARTATEVDPGDVSHRIDAQGARDEVRVLADSFDRMLDRLADAFARQRSFVSDASHELRTPLTVIAGQLEVLARQREISADEVRRVERMVRTEVARMQRLVADLSLLARADEGNLVRAETLDVDELVSELFDGLTLIADRRFELSPLPGGTLRADGDRLAQAIRNLARNAVEHTAEGGLVRLVVRPLDAGRLELAVEDDGPGIPADQRAHIFDRFHRTDAARTRAVGGSGLGLAIVRAIAEGHGGAVAAGAAPEGGARVAFTLPAWLPPTGETTDAPYASRTPAGA